jgi:hypothetical protein
LMMRCITSTVLTGLPPRSNKVQLSNVEPHVLTRND